MKCNYIILVGIFPCLLGKVLKEAQSKHSQNTYCSCFCYTEFNFYPWGLEKTNSI